ncbi:prephenate dehydrogenase [Ferrimonas lipolytica]|uniref:Prephenate dehydrogenase n=1 Tax=Ferrimonas lipolytica TaxID=2724191 RepID=A0A6H1UJ41_9GAMM|nr:prephenate dehydrogenase [Ferrimonas lipolytica]QIZ78630.1 prephenate dehydrogenase [Ferrimonas lipolytica]
MSYQTIIDQIRNSLQTAYRQGIDADAVLDQIQKDGQGKFAAIFTSEAGFSTDSNRFGPYVKEMGQSLIDFEANPSNDQLATLVKQLELLLTTLAQFRQQVKATK